MIFTLSFSLKCSQKDQTYKLNKEASNSILAALQLSSIGSETNEASNDNDVKCEKDVSSDYFNFQSRDVIILQIPVINANEPYVEARVDISNQKGKLILSGFTDKNGYFTEKISIFDGDDIYAEVKAIGVPSEPVLVYSSTNKIISNSVSYSECNINKLNEIKLLTVGSYDSNGILFSTMINQSVSTSLLQDINFALPERIDLRNSHPEYILNGVDTNLKIEAEADVWITFLHEGAGNKNSFGYFTYTDSNKPKTVSEINKIAVFPNASFKGSGGNLSSGDKVYLGRFPAKTRIGFWLISNGWNGRNIDESKLNIFSIPELNVESNSELKKHMAVLWSEREQTVVIGVEDLNRELTSCDHDFNDVIFSVDANPIESINLDNVINLPGRTDIDGDGIADNNDPYPYDSERTYTRYFPGSDTYAIMAFEDLFPSKGDYDFNDMVVKFRIKETLTPGKLVKDIDADFELMAVGAANQNGLMLLIETNENNIESASRSINGGSPISALEKGHINEVSLKIIDNARNQIKYANGYNFANTLPGSPKTLGDKINLKITFKSPVTDSAPFNPFLFNVNNRPLEIHFVNKRPSEMFDKKLFQSKDDRSVPQKSIYFQDSVGYPWAMLLGEDFEQPNERVSINQAYTNFSEWVVSNGSKLKDWVFAKNIVKIFR